MQRCKRPVVGGNLLHLYWPLESPLWLKCGVQGDRGGRELAKAFL